MKKIKSQDEVIIIAGKSKGQTGKVIEVLADDRVKVAGANLVKKHVKPNPQINEPGGIKEMEAPLHVSNVALLNPETDKADRVGFRIEDGKKVRYFKSNGKTVSA